MPNPLLIVTATDALDPVVGSSPTARAGLTALHAALIASALKNGLQPVVMRSEVEKAPDECYTRPEVLLVQSTYDSTLPMADMLVSVFSMTNIADTEAVVFDDALGFDVDIFVECWRRIFPASALPPLYGFVHSTNHNGFAQKSVLEWYAAQSGKLRRFAGLFTLSEQAAFVLRVGQTGLDPMPVAPLLAAPALRKKPRAGLDDVVRLNWMYSFSHVDHYHRYLLLCNLLNKGIQEEIARATVEDPIPEGTPARYEPHLYSREFPQGMAMPLGFKPGDFAQGQRFDFGMLDHAMAWPVQDSVTVSFKSGAESDPRLLHLAATGYMVLAPNTGIYREGLDPICLYDARLLERFSNDVPDQVTGVIARDLGERILALRAEWMHRLTPARAEKNGVRVAPSANLIRPASVARINGAIEQVADRIMSDLDYVA